MEDNKENVEVTPQADLAKEIITDIACGLQQFVYVREEGDRGNPNDAIMHAGFVEINKLLVETAKKYGVEGFTETAEDVENPSND